MIAENPQPDRPIGTASDRDLGGPTAPGEKVEAESDAFISRRDKQRPKTEGERDEEALWRASERRAEATRREANRREWVEHHLGQADRLRANLGSLISHHEAEAQRHYDDEGSAA